VAVRSNLITLLLQNADVLISTRESVEKTFEAYMQLLDAPVQPSMAVTVSIKGELLVATTTLLIEKDAITEFAPQLETFVEWLYNALLAVNKDAEGPLRQIAAECLLELEETYPGLLYTVVFDVVHPKNPLNVAGLLYSLVTNECGHIRQSYVKLFLSCVQHCTTQRFHTVTKQKAEEEAAQQANPPSRRADKHKFVEVEPRTLELYRREEQAGYAMTVGVRQPAAQTCQRRRTRLRGAGATIRP